MSDYLLFIDIEASDLPKRWDLPYSAEGNWPYTIQVSWIIFTKEGQHVKTEDLYIKDLSVNICKRARKVHGLTQEFININGKKREEVLAVLSQDLQTYQPIIVGHFIELDFHVLSADYHRVGVENPMKNLPFFCTMLATKHLVRNPAKKYLRLEELYNQLFDTCFSNQHNAFEDAKATADCLFELVKRKEVDLATDHRKDILLPVEKTAKGGCAFSLLLTLIILFILFINL